MARKTFALQSDVGKTAMKWTKTAAQQTIFGKESAAIRTEKTPIRIVFPVIRSVTA